MLQPVTEFADTTQIVRQSLWVETNFDSDRDGKPDRVHVQVTRPGAAEKAGLKIPTIMLSSPYIARTRGNATNWEVEHELGAPSPPRTIPEFRAYSDTMRLKQVHTQWVPRGFAAVTVDNAGTSMGCPTVGDSIEKITPKFAIDPAAYFGDVDQPFRLKPDQAFRRKLTTPERSDAGVDV